MEKEVSESERKATIKKKYQDKLEYYLSRDNIEDQEIYSIVRKFFLEFLKLDYEFTYEELSLELNKVYIRPQIKKNIDDFLLSLSESEYLEENSLTIEDIKEYIKQFQSIINDLIFEEKLDKKQESIFDKVLNKKSDKKSEIETLQTLIDQTSFYLSNGNLDKAKKSYKDTLSTFDLLDKDSKKIFKDKITKLYSDIQYLIKNPGAKIESYANNSPQDTAPKENISNEYNLISKIQADTSQNVESENTISNNNNSNILELQKIDDNQNLQYNLDVQKTKKINLQDTLKDTSNLKSNKTLESSDSTKILSSQENIVLDFSTKQDSISDDKKDHDSSKDNLKTAKATSNAKETKDATNNAVSKSSKNTQENKLFQPVFNENFSKITNLIDETSFFVETKKSDAAKKSYIELLKAYEVLNLDDKKLFHEKILKLYSAIQNFNSKEIISKTNKTPEIKTYDAKEKSISKENPIQISDIISNTESKKIPANSNSDLKISTTEFDKNIAESLKHLGNNNLIDAEKYYILALKEYNLLDTAQKKSVYNRISLLFKKIDDKKHEQSLNDILSKHSVIKDHDEKILDKAAKKNLSLIPLNQELTVSENEVNIIRINELVEESYFNIAQKNLDIALLKYFKSLELYHSLSSENKKKLYWNVYLLFKKLSSLRIASIKAT